MGRKICTLVAATLLAWVILVIPARHWWGDQMLVYSCMAAGLCVLPAVLTVIIVDLVGRSSHDHQLYAILGGSVVRMFLVLFVGLMLYQAVPPFQAEDAFLYWLLAFYMITLVLEKSLVLKGWLCEKREGTAPSAP